MFSLCSFLEGGASWTTPHSTSCAEAARGLEGRLATEAVFRSLGIGPPDERQYGVFQEWFANKKTPEQVRSMAAQGYEGEQAVNKLYNGILNRPADPDGSRHYQDKLAKGQEISDLRRELVSSEECRAAISKIIETELGIRNPNTYLQSFIQSSLLSENRSLSDILDAISFDPPKDPTFFAPAVTPNNDPINKTFLPEGTVYKLLSGSQTASKQLDALNNAGWHIVFGDTHNGVTAETRAPETIIVVNPAYKDDIYKMAGAIAHELGHFYIKNKYNYASKEKFIKSALRGEGAATINNYIIRAELGNTIWAGGGYDAQADADLKAAYDKGVKDNNFEKAYEEVGEVYRTKVKFPDGKTYGEHYAEYFDNVIKRK